MNRMKSPRLAKVATAASSGVIPGAGPIGNAGQLVSGGKGWRASVSVSSPWSSVCSLPVDRSIDRVRTELLQQGALVDVARGQAPGELLQASARETTRQHSALLSSRLLGLGNQGRDELRVWTRDPLGVAELALAWRTDCIGNRLAMEVEAADVRVLPFVAMLQTPSLGFQPTGGNQFNKFLDMITTGKWYTMSRPKL